jgi:hypothetical protein
MELTPGSFLDDHATNLAVEVAENVVQVGAPCIGGNSSRVSLELGSLEDGSATTAFRWNGTALRFGLAMRHIGANTIPTAGRAETIAPARARADIKIFILGDDKCGLINVKCRRCECAD